MAEQQLSGGVANAGSVVRVGDHILRPANPHTPSIHRFLRALAAAGFDGASVPVGVDPDGRERLEFLPGDVPIPPYPDWAQADAVLASAAELVRRFHDASRRFDPTGLSWSDEMADPAGGPVVIHNDVCLENVVFRDGVAVGLLDFDFAAPGRPVYDLAVFARMCVPLDPDVNSVLLGFHPSDRPARLALVADVYGLVRPEREQLLECLTESIRSGGEFMLRRVEAGDPNFTKVWNEIGGMARFDRRREWWSQTRPQFATALL